MIKTDLNQKPNLSDANVPAGVETLVLNNSFIYRRNSKVRKFKIDC